MNRFDEMVDHFLAMEQETPFSGLLDELASWVALKEGDWVLDVGAGPGGLLGRLEAGRKVALDLSFEMSKRARTMGHLAVQGDALQLPLRDDSFAAAFATNLLHLVPDPSLALRELHRVLVLGAPLLCIVPGRRMSEANLVPYLREHHGEEIAEALSGWGRSADNNRRFTEEDLSDLLYEAGFSDVELHPRWDDLALLAKAIR